MEKTRPWIVIVRGETDGKEVRVALDFQDAESLLSPSSFTVGQEFIDRILSLIQLHDHWLIKTIVEEVWSPDETRLSPDTPSFTILSRSKPRGLSAGALFIGQEHRESTISTPSNSKSTSTSLLNTSIRYPMVGIAPVGFAAACAEDPRLFPRFITRLLQRPQAFEEVSLLIPRNNSLELPEKIPK